MRTTSGVGYSNRSQSFEAGTDAASMAIVECGSKEISLCILFFTAKHDPVKVTEGIRSVVGPGVKMIGGSTVGVITKDKLSYGGFEVGVALISSTDANFEIFQEMGLGNGEEFSVGQKLADQINRTSVPSNVILFYDSVRGQPGSLLNMATPLIRGLTERIDSSAKVNAGAGLLGDMQFKETFQVFNGSVSSQTAMALAMSGKMRVDTTIIHGCKPAGSYHKITKTDGATVLEIDGKPATEVIAAMLGPESDKEWKDYPLFITLGVNKGKKFEDFKEENYANRLCMAIDPDRKGLVMFEPDLQAGDEVQLMRRETNFDYIKKRVEDLYQVVGDREPFFALYIDCIGRASAFCGTESEEASEIQKLVGSKMPLLGLYTGVEVAQVGNVLQALDWTGVLCIFSASKN